MSRFIDVNITDDTTPISQAGFGLGFILDPVESEMDEYDYTEIMDLEDVPENASELAEDMVNQYLSQTPNPGNVAIQGVYIDGTDGTAEDVGDALDQVVEENNDWYGLLLASREQTEIEEADDWVPANKLFITSPVEPSWDELKEYDLLSDKTGSFPHTEEREYDAAIMSKMFTTDPGSATWKWQELSGVDSSGYPSAEVSSMLDPDEGEPTMNPMIYEMGVDYTAEGKNVNGGYLDIQRTIDWLEARLTENIFGLMINNDKIPYDNSGIAQVKAKMKEIFKQATNRGIVVIEDGEALWNIDAPEREDVPTNDRANRVLPDVNFNLTAAGAIHEVDISGAVKV